MTIETRDLVCTEDTASTTAKRSGYPVIGAITTLLKGIDNALVLHNYQPNHTALKRHF